jgi:hypothetical protein
LSREKKREATFGRPFFSHLSPFFYSNSPYLRRVATRPLPGRTSTVPERRSSGGGGAAREEEEEEVVEEEGETIDADTASAAVAPMPWPLTPKLPLLISLLAAPASSRSASRDTRAEA